MAAERWFPDSTVVRLIIDKAPPVRGMPPRLLLAMAHFYVKDKLINGMAGITFHKDRVMLDKSILTWPKTSQASIVYHELVHVAQMLSLPQGWSGFMVTYLGEWIRSGFSYKRMCKFGLEEEAYRMQGLLERKLYNAAA